MQGSCQSAYSGPGPPGPASARPAASDAGSREYPRDVRLARSLHFLGVHRSPGWRGREWAPAKKPTNQASPQYGSTRPLVGHPTPACHWEREPPESAKQPSPHRIGQGAAAPGDLSRGSRCQHREPRPPHTKRGPGPGRVSQREQTLGRKPKSGREALARTERGCNYAETGAMFGFGLAGAGTRPLMRQPTDRRTDHG